MSILRESDLISLRKSVDELTRLEELEKREALSNTILDCYALAIRSTADYAVEVAPAPVVEFRAHLNNIEQQCRAAQSADQLIAAQASFRGELRQYRDQSAGHLLKLRREVENATTAMTIFAETVAANGDDHELQLGVHLKRLESTAKSDSIVEIRAGIGAAVLGIQSSLESMKRSNQLVVAQLQDEIRALHQQIEQERKALFTDRASGAWNRQKIDLHLDNLLRQNQPFCLLLVWIRNFKRTENQHTCAIVEGALRALVGRFRNTAGHGAVVGRWAQDQFVAVLDLPAARAMALSEEAARKLTGNYQIQENGQSQNVLLQASAGVIDRNSGVDAASFLQKLDQLAAAISGA
jgi:GGDEF domain-containing protein